MGKITHISKREHEKRKQKIKELKQKRNLIKNNLYQVYRGDGLKMIEAYKKAKSESSKIFLKQVLKLNLYNKNKRRN
jgi:hypothetical protein